MIKNIKYLRFSSVASPIEIKSINIRNIEFYVRDVLDNSPNSELAKKIREVLSSSGKYNSSDDINKIIEKLLLNL